jgi:GTP1/Obg family GTP-binding protein
MQAARSMDTLMKGITKRLNVYLSQYPAFDDLHPFEQSLLDLSVGTANYERILKNVDKVRKSVNQVQSLRGARVVVNLICFRFGIGLTYGHEILPCAYEL